MKAWMGGRKRKLGVERKSQVNQQRQFFAQRREALERREQLDAGSAKRQQVARFEDFRSEQRPRKRGPLFPTLGRDLVALKPVKVAASGVIQMHSVADPIHDFENVNSANVTGLSMATCKSLRQGETKLKHTRAIEPSTGPSKSALKDCLAESENHTASRVPYFPPARVMTTPFTNAQIEDVGETTERAEDSDKRLEMHSDYSNLQKGRTPFAEPPRTHGPLRGPVDTPREASNFREDKFAEERQREASAPSSIPWTVARESLETAEAPEYDDTRSPFGSRSRELEVDPSVPLETSVPLEDVNCLPTAVTRPSKVTIRPFQIDPDGFNASVESFEAGFFKLADTEVRAFSRRPVIQQDLSHVIETEEISPIPRPSISNATNETTAKDDKHEIVENEADCLSGQPGQHSEDVPAGNAGVVDEIALPIGDMVCKKRTPSPPALTFLPASNPFTAARKTTDIACTKTRKSIQPFSSFEVKPSHDSQAAAPSNSKLPSFKELIQHTSREAQVANGGAQSGTISEPHS